METEFDFILPRGYIDENGTVHQNGRMRLATARDEIQSVQHPLAQNNEAYLPILLLAQVIIQLGPLVAITPQHIENLFASDIAYLQDLYLRINSSEQLVVDAICPHCTNQFQLQVAPIG